MARAQAARGGDAIPLEARARALATIRKKRVEGEDL